MEVGTYSHALKTTSLKCSSLEGLLASRSCKGMRTHLAHVHVCGRQEVEEGSHGSCRVKVVLQPLPNLTARDGREGMEGEEWHGGTGGGEYEQERQKAAPGEAVATVPELSCSRSWN